MEAVKKMTILYNEKDHLVLDWGYATFNWERVGEDFPADTMLEGETLARYQKRIETNSKLSYSQKLQYLAEAPNKYLTQTRSGSQ